MTNFAYPWAFAALLLPFVVWYILPAAKGLHGDALRVPFLKGNLSGLCFADNRFGTSAMGRRTRAYP